MEKFNKIVYNCRKGGVILEECLNYIAEKLAKNSDYSKEVMKFSLKLWASTLFQSACMAIIAYIFFDIYYFLIFFAVLFLLRIMIAGYHCKTFRGCFLLSNITFIGVSVISTLTMKYEMLSYFAFLMLIVATIYLIGISVINYCKDLKYGIRDKFYFAIRIIYQVLISGYLLYNIKSGNTLQVHEYVMLYSYCMVFILTIMKGGKTNEE